MSVVASSSSETPWYCWRRSFAWVTSDCWTSVLLLASFNRSPDSARDLAVELGVAQSVNAIGILRRNGKGGKRERDAVGNFGRAGLYGRQLVRGRRESA